MSLDYDHEPIHKRARALLQDPRIGPVLYWDLQNQNYCPDGDKYQATAWRTIPDYQGGECCSVSSFLWDKLMICQLWLSSSPCLSPSATFCRSRSLRYPTQLQ